MTAPARMLALFAAVLLAILSAAAAPPPIPESVPLPDMSGPSTCVAVYERQADGSEVFLGASESPAFHGDRRDLRALMDVHVRHALQFVGRTHGRTEAWLAARDAEPILFTPGPVSPDYTRQIGDPPPGGNGVCWCATPTRDPVTKAVTGCDFPCGSCEHCVVPGEATASPAPAPDLRGPLHMVACLPFDGTGPVRYYRGRTIAHRARVCVVDDVCYYGCP